MVRPGAWQFLGAVKWRLWSLTTKVGNKLIFFQFILHFFLNLSGFFSTFSIQSFNDWTFGIKRKKDQVRKKATHSAAAAPAIGFTISCLRVCVEANERYKRERERAEIWHTCRVLYFRMYRLIWPCRNMMWLLDNMTCSKLFQTSPSLTGYGR